MRHKTAWSLVICGLLLLTFCLGLPQFHYAVALMVTAITRYGDSPLSEPLFRFGAPRAAGFAKGKET